MSADRDTFRQADAVSWRTHGTTAHGTVEKKIAADAEAAGQKVRVSADDRQYLVRSDTSGRTAVHTPDALTRTESGTDS